MASNTVLKARARVAVRNRKRKVEADKIAIQAREDALIERLLANLTLPIAKDGKDGRDAPTLPEILSSIELPKPEIHHTETTVVQEVNPTDMEVFIKGLLPEIQPEDKPAVEQITVDVSEEKLEGFVSKKEFNKALERIQDAITANQSGGHRAERNDDLPWHVASNEVRTLANREQAAIHGEFLLEGNLILDGSAQLVIEN